MNHNHKGHICVSIFAVLCLPFCVGAKIAAKNTVRFDFETGDMQDWRIVEGEFDYFVSDRPEFHNSYPGVSRRYNKQGKYYLSTVEQQPGMPSNDRMTGIAESPIFFLTAPTMTFLIGGGSSGQTYVALYTLDHEVVVKAHGRNTEVMERITWNRPELVGKAVFLRIVDKNPGPWGYIAFDDFMAQGKIDKTMNLQRAKIAEQARLNRTRRNLMTKCQPLEAAIRDLIETFGARYRSGHKFLSTLASIKQQAKTADMDTLPVLSERFADLRHKALTANPLVSDQAMLFITRHQYRSHYHAVDMLFHTDEFNVDRNTPHSDLFQGPGAMKVIDFKNGAKVTTLVEAPQGIVRDPQVHFDGQRIVFAMRRHVDEDYRIWEINTDGTHQRQLTGASGVSDVDPIYLPDDSIVFSSTREPKYNMCSRDHAANLFRMESDGANIHQITKNTLVDNHSELMADGRILYARWEYVDRNFGDAHGLWTVNPDGTNQSVYWGNNTAVPGAAFNAHEIPSSHQVLCVFGPHHDRLWGALAIIDRRLGLDGRQSVIRTWPPEAADAVREGGNFDCDFHQRSVKIKYEDPWPLSNKYFLSSRMIGQGEQTGIYLIDIFGNEILLHTEAPGCYDPMPIKASARPPIIPSRRRFADQPGYFFVADVYQGSHMEDVESGSVKYLRVVESPEKRHWARGSWGGQGYTAPAMNWHSLENKRILGTVPVEADGSAYFEVPAETFVYFQLLDQDHMMIQSMRSGTIAQPGEHTGCVGCHDQRSSSPAALGVRIPLAMKRQPSKLKGWYGPARSFSFMREVQPVLDKHCVTCHDYGTESGNKLNLAPDRTLAFNTAYMELWRKGYLRCVGGGPAPVQAAYSWGSHASKLIQALRSRSVPEHKDLDLSSEEFARVVAWVDLNAVYYPTYACAYPESRTGRSPLTNEQLNTLTKLTGQSLSDTMNYGSNRGPQVSFDRPELSPCLTHIADQRGPEYQEALAIIQTGARTLMNRPRADMAGFEPCPTDLKREQKYRERERVEQENRRAILNSAKLYDSSL